MRIQQRNAESLDRILTGGNSVAHSNNSRHRKRAIAIADVESSHSRGGGATTTGHGVGYASVPKNFTLQAAADGEINH